MSETPEDLYTVVIVPPEADDNDLIDLLVKLLKGRDWPCEVVDHARRIIFYLGSNEVIVNGNVIRGIWWEDIVGDYTKKEPEPEKEVPSRRRQGNVIRVKTNLNIRSQPSKSGDRIGVLPLETPVYILDGPDANGWLKILMDNEVGFGFVHGYYIKEL